ncbi:hypothetical protein VHEMI01126 [[Torrubiella] hemipterigena]|uniref:Uncharacterized protein n=1 Tax=[Torrubiella] hemipterigena TaxID=1531966 RepID=A0A0A1SS90_9HYPO|nr:hypothetical protein VHEMI01126 [[Torrubiella] hemipterigena]
MPPMNERSRPMPPPISSRQRVPAGTVPAGDARTQMFRGHMMRRQAAAAPAVPLADSMRLDATVQTEVLDIVVRDQHGEIELGDPPSLIFDDLDDVVLDDGQETEKERQRLTDAVNTHRINQHTTTDQAEVLEALKSSLRAKVSALAEDNWMFEPEDQTRV